MKLLWLISQDENNDYDTYDSAVVCATNEEAARMTTPDGRPFGKKSVAQTWATKPENVTVKLIGTAADSVAEGVVLASFNAG